MNRDEVVAEVAARLGNRTDLDAKIQSNLGHVQKYILEKMPILPWFLITEELYDDTVAEEERLALPSGFLREIEEGALWRKITDSSDTDHPWVELKKMPFDSLRATLGDELDKTGAPTHYAIFGNYWVFFPVPDAAYRIQTRIYESDTLPADLASGTSTNQWMTHEAELLIAETVMRMARHLQWNRTILSEFREDRDEARRNYMINQEARNHANLRYRMGIARGN